jgi:hypothetical protein
LAHEKRYSAKAGKKRAKKSQALSAGVLAEVEGSCREWSEPLIFLVAWQSNLFEFALASFACVRSFYPFPTRSFDYGEYAFAQE